MRRPLFCLGLVYLLIVTSLFAQDADSGKASFTAQVPGTVIPIIAYAVGEGVPADSLSLHQGDSVFVFDGELFFRARIKGQDFFVSKREILEHADSLVIYQNYRIGSQGREAGQKGVDAGSQKKIERQQCSMITKNGTRCKRLAMPGSTRCWQHKK